MSDQNWIVKGFEVVVLSYEHGTRAIRLHTIESVAGKSFVVNGDRYQKDSLEHRSPHPYDPSKRVYHPGTEKGRALVAEMKLREQLKFAQGASYQFSRMSLDHKSLVGQAKLAVRQLTSFIEVMEKSQAEEL